MSGSPKHCQARLTAEQERRLEEERRQREAEALRQRLAEEERRRKLRLQAVQRSATEDAKAIVAEATTFQGMEAASFVPQELGALLQQLNACRQKIEKAVDEGEVARAGVDLAAVRDELKQVIARGNAAKQTRDMRREEAALVELREQIAALDQHRSLKHDMAGWTAVCATIERAEKSLARQAPAEAAQLVQQAKLQLNEHRANVAAKHNAEANARLSAQQPVATADDAVAGIATDSVVMRWRGNQVEQLQQRCTRAQSLIQEGQFQAAIDESRAIQQSAQQLLTDAQELQHKESRRNYIVQGIQQVLQKLGFVIDPGFPSLEHSNQPESATWIRSRRVGGGVVAISIPQDGEIWYTVDEFPQRSETGVDGATISTCDEAETQINRVHDELHSAFGVEMSELQWEGKDPNRVHRQAMRLPDGASEKSSGQRAQSRSH